MTEYHSNLHKRLQDAKANIDTAPTPEKEMFWMQEVANLTELISLEEAEL